MQSFQTGIKPIPLHLPHSTSLNVAMSCPGVRGIREMVCRRAEGGGARVVATALGAATWLWERVGERTPGGVAGCVRAYRQ